MTYQKDSQVTLKEAGTPIMRIFDLSQMLSKLKDGGPVPVSEGLATSTHLSYHGSACQKKKGANIQIPVASEYFKVTESKLPLKIFLFNVVFTRISGTV